MSFESDTQTLPLFNIPFGCLDTGTRSITLGGGGIFLGNLGCVRNDSASHGKALHPRSSAPQTRKQASDMSEGLTKRILHNSLPMRGIGPQFLSSTRCKNVRQEVRVAFDMSCTVCSVHRAQCHRVIIHPDSFDNYIFNGDSDDH